MASAESSASLNAPDLGVAAVKTKKARKSATPKRVVPGNKRVVAPKAKSNWLDRAEAAQLKSREQKESGAFVALKDKKTHLIRGVAPSKFGEGKFLVWIEGRGEEGIFDLKDALNLSEKLCKEHKPLLEHFSSFDPAGENYPKNTIQMLESKVFPDKGDSSVAWKSVTKVKFAAVQQAEPEDAEMTEEDDGE